MPRITPLRVVSLLPLTWLCLITTWLILPSPGLSRASREATVDASLRTGRAVTAAVRYSKSYGDAYWGSRPDGLLVDWKLESDHESDSVMLIIGLEKRVNLTEAALKGAQYFSEAAPAALGVSGLEGSRKPYVSELLGADVAAAEEDDLYIMPWFAWADKLLISYQFRHSRGSLKFRLYVPEPCVVQVWKDLSVLDRLTNPADIRDSDRETGLIATFSDIPVAHFAGANVRASIASIRITNLAGELPSRTWPIRYMIAQPLYIPVFFPLNIIRFFIIGPLSLTVFSAACVLAVLVKWQLAGRPPFREWIVQLPYMVFCCRTQSRKARRRGVWGPSGPMADEESGLLGKNPNTTFTTPFNPVFKPTKSRPRVFDRA
ncbi:hypothetical protein Micbo1qcDRAFT_162219 [Microdochium bolleyi]|uniref:Uncharacterized protein n=1 Tax=Microdochium bolleyi TaxID=196109 RepID=A0A136J4L5_9PEZI|nr:hypothetical protein Micbo1qcDRAFT_162219 [Microdochium bolleyi]